MSVIPDALRSAVLSSALGDLEFTPSGGTVLYYEARVYDEGTATLRATKYLGLSAPYAATGKIKVSIGTTLNALPAGNYDVTVAAVGAGGTDESAPANAYTVPLQAA